MLGLLPGVNGVSMGDPNSAFVNYLGPQHPRDEDAFPRVGGAVRRHPRGRHPAAAAVEWRRH
jgi:hypothetical protein